METIIKWILPCYFNTQNESDKEMTFDLTPNFKEIVKNEFWNRPFEFGFSNIFKDIDFDKVIRITIKVKPRFTSGMVNPQRLIEFVENEIKTVPEYLKIDNYSKWNQDYGIVIIELTHEFEIEELPNEEDVQKGRYTSGFVREYNLVKSLLKEIASHFIAGIHLTYPTHSILNWNEDPINVGIINFERNKRVYATTFSTDMFMHHVLIDTKRIETLIGNLQGLSKVWHHNLWSLKRYMISLQSNRASMDNLLDLLYALEGMFDKGASADFIKLFCITSLASNKKEAENYKGILDKAFQIRNDIVHGAKYYTGYEKIKINGKETLAESIFWEMKTVLTLMLVKAIVKLLKNKEMKNLYFNSEDLLNNIYKKNLA